MWDITFPICLLALGITCSDLQAKSKVVDSDTRQENKRRDEIWSLKVKMGDNLEQTLKTYSIWISSNVLGRQISYKICEEERHIRKMSPYDHVSGLQIWPNRLLLIPQRAAKTAARIKM